MLQCAPRPMRKLRPETGVEDVDDGKAGVELTEGGEGEGRSGGVHEEDEGIGGDLGQREVDGLAEGLGGVTAEAGGDDGHEEGAGLAAEKSKGEFDVGEATEEVLEPGREPGFTDLFADLGESSEFDGGLAAGLGFGESGGEEIVDAAVEVREGGP